MSYPIFSAWVHSSPILAHWAAAALGALWLLLTRMAWQRLAPSVKGASGTWRERVARESQTLTYKGSERPGEAEAAPISALQPGNLPHPASLIKHLPLWIHPSLIPPYMQSRLLLRRRSRALARAPRARKRNSKPGCVWWTVCYAVLNFGRRIQLPGWACSESSMRYPILIFAGHLTRKVIHEISYFPQDILG